MRPCGLSVIDIAAPARSEGSRRGADFNNLRVENQQLGQP